MNVSNSAYFQPLTINKPGLQKEGFDPSTEIEDPWYAPTEKVIPRVYHKYLKASDLENIYGPAEEEDQPEPTPEPEPQPQPEPQPEPDHQTEP